MGKVANAESGLVGTFAEGVVAYRKRKWKEAVDAFERVMSAPQTEEEASAPDVRGRARAYRAIAQANLNPLAPTPETGDDLLWDGLFHLNAGSLDEAGARLEAAVAAKDTRDKPYAHYLLAMVHARKGDAQAAADALKMAVQAEAGYRILAFNERDFASLREQPTFKSLLG